MGNTPSALGYLNNTPSNDGQDRKLQYLGIGPDSGPAPTPHPSPDSSPQASSDPYAMRETKLARLAEARFDSALTASERKVLFDSVRPGPPPAPQADAHGQVVISTRTVRGTFLRWIAVDSEASVLLDPDGLQVTYATVTGEIDLYAVRMGYSLNFVSCLLQGPLVLNSATAQNINILHCQIQSGLRAGNLGCTGELVIADTSCDGPFDLVACRVDKTLRLIYSDVKALKDSALALSQAIIGGDLDLQGLNCSRELRALDATVGGSIILKGANLSFTGDAIHLDGANVGAELFLDALDDPRTGKKTPFRCAGNFSAPHIRVGEDIHASSALFQKADGVIDFGAARVKDGSIDFDGIRAWGALLLAAVQVGQGISIDDAVFYKEADEELAFAISLEDSEIGESVSFDNLTSSAVVLVRGTTIKANFSCKGSKLHELLIVQTGIGRDLIAEGSAFNQYFIFRDTRVGGQLSLKKITCGGFGVSGERDWIGGDLRLDGAVIDVGAGRTAVLMNNVEIGGGLIMSRSFVASGPVQVSYCTVGENVLCVGSSFDSLQVTNTKITGWLYWFGIENARATVLNLSDSTVSRIYDDRNSWPAQDKLNVNGLKYGELILCVSPSPKQVAEVILPEAAPQDATDRIDWLKLQNSQLVTSSQPWQELAVFFDNRGDSASAKQVRYMMGRVQGYSGGKALRILSWPYDSVQENPLRVTVPIASLWIVGTLVFWRANRMRAMAPTDKDALELFEEHQPNSSHLPFQPAIYALELVLPVVKLGQDNIWGPNPRFEPPERSSGWRRLIPRISYQSLAILRWTLILLGWALALILVGAIGSKFKS